MKGLARQTIRFGETWGGEPALRDISGEVSGWVLTLPDGTSHRVIAKPSLVYTPAGRAWRTVLVPATQDWLPDWHCTRPPEWIASRDYGADHVAAMRDLGFVPTPLDTYGLSDLIAAIEEYQPTTERT